jgi:hypothetical protein
VQYLARHKGHVIAENRRMGPRDLQAFERTHFHHDVSYKQGWRTREHVIEKLDGREEECFSQFPAHITRFKTASKNNYATPFPSRDNKFKAAFFALSACRQTYDAIREMTFIDGTRTFSKFKMILFLWPMQLFLSKMSTGALGSLIN